MVIYTDGTHDRATSEEYHGNYTYLLNRNNVRPIKTVDGWYLFAIKLPRTDKPFVEFRFEVNNAPMHLKAAEAPESYADVPDSPDVYAQYRKQRHNIVFEDGWPSEHEYGGDIYSTAAIRKRLEAEARGESDAELGQDDEDDIEINTGSWHEGNSERLQNTIAKLVSEQLSKMFDGADW